MSYNKYCKCCGHFIDDPRKRQCTRCLEIKDEDNFYRRGKDKQYFICWCKDCFDKDTLVRQKAARLKKTLEKNGVK